MGIRITRKYKVRHDHLRGSVKVTLVELKKNRNENTNLARACEGEEERARAN